MRRVKVQWQGELVEGEEVDFEVIREDWNVYKTSDGSKLKLKPVVGKIVRLDKRNTDGEPVYVLNSQNMVVAQVEPHLMLEGR
jgi:ABC-type ATPase with predicted acetyltransferase domain